MAKNQGFTLIELVTFAVILGLISSIILATTVFALRYSPASHAQTLAATTSSGCMDYLLGQRALKGFTFNAQTCPGGADDTKTWEFCSSVTPTGFTTSVKISCISTPIPGIQAYKLITVTTTGPAAGISTLNSLIADY